MRDNYRLMAENSLGWFLDVHDFILLVFATHFAGAGQ